MAGKTILTINSNMDPRHKGEIEGHHHVWLTVKHGDQPASHFGLWPNWDDVDGRLRRTLKTRGWDGSGTNVQQDIETRFAKLMKPAQSRSWALDDAKAAELHRLLSTPATYSKDANNCADWAYGIVSKITGVKLKPLKEDVPREDNPFVARKKLDTVETIAITSPRYVQRSLLPCEFYAAATGAVWHARDSERQPVVLMQRDNTSPKGGTPVASTLLALAGISKLSKMAAAIS